MKIFSKQENQFSSHFVFPKVVAGNKQTISRRKQPSSWAKHRVFTMKLISPLIIIQYKFFNAWLIHCTAVLQLMHRLHKTSQLIHVEWVELHKMVVSFGFYKFFFSFYSAFTHNKANGNGIECGSELMHRTINDDFLLSHLCEQSENPFGLLTKWNYCWPFRCAFEWVRARESFSVHKEHMKEWSGQIMRTHAIFSPCICM